MVLTCLAIVEERHQGHISLVHATLQLVNLLPDNDMEINHKHALASSRGNTTNEAIVSRDVQRTPDRIPAQTPSGIISSMLK